MIGDYDALREPVFPDAAAQRPEWLISEIQRFLACPAIRKWRPPEGSGLRATLSGTTVRFLHALQAGFQA